MISSCRRCDHGVGVHLVFLYDTVRQFKFETPTWTAYFFYSCIMSQSCCAMYETGFRTAAINVIERSPSLRVAAHLIGVSKASLSRWSKRIVPRAWHKTPSTRVLRVIDIVRHLLRCKTYFSLTLLSRDIASLYDIYVSKQLLHLILIKRFNYSFKRTKSRGVSKATPPRQLLRRYARFHECYTRALERGNIVAIDECGFDQRCKPAYAYSPVGTSPIVPYNTCHDRNRYSLVMAISYQNAGCESHLAPSSCKSTDFRDFVSGLPFRRGTTLVLDNASTHKTKTVREIAKQKKYRLLFTPPYTPEANPIELIFGIIKKAFYKIRYEHDFENLPCAISKSMSRVPVDSIPRCFHHAHHAMDQIQMSTHKFNVSHN